MTGDGLSDFIMPAGPNIKVWINLDGEHWGAPHDIDMAFFPPWDAGRTQISFGDMNGSGVEDIVVVGSAGEQGQVLASYVDMRGGERPGLLTKIQGEHGAEVNLYYESVQHAQAVAEAAGNPWRTHTPQIPQVVFQMQVKDQSAPRIERHEL